MCDHTERDSAPAHGDANSAWCYNGPDDRRHPSVCALSMLGRTKEGLISSWSPGMEQRYGFTREQALGRVVPLLLRTIFLQPLLDIERTLTIGSRWSGVLLHHCADGHPVLVVNHWSLACSASDEADVVTEIHSDFRPSLAVQHHGLAELLAAVTHELSEPLTAIAGYVGGARALLHSNWPRLDPLRQAVRHLGEQTTRSADAVRVLRALVEAMRHSDEPESRIPPVRAQAEPCILVPPGVIR